MHVPSACMHFQSIRQTVRHLLDESTSQCIFLTPSSESFCKLSDSKTSSSSKYSKSSLAHCCSDCTCCSRFVTTADDVRVTCVGETSARFESLSRRLRSRWCLLAFTCSKSNRSLRYDITGRWRSAILLAEIHFEQ